MKVWFTLSRKNNGIEGLGEGEIHSHSIMSSASGQCHLLMYCLQWESEEIDSQRRGKRRGLELRVLRGKSCPQTKYLYNHQSTHLPLVVFTVFSGHCEPPGVLSDPVSSPPFSCREVSVWAHTAFPSLWYRTCFSGCPVWNKLGSWRCH